MTANRCGARFWAVHSLMSQRLRLSRGYGHFTDEMRVVHGVAKQTHKSPPTEGGLMRDGRR